MNLKNFDFNELQFIKLDLDYVKYLHSIDSQVFYVNTPSYETKPYVGILINRNNYDYVIPLTSAKVRHLDWNLESRSNIIIYEDVDISQCTRSDIYKIINDSDPSAVRRLLSVIEIRKMLPIKYGVFEKYDFTSVDIKKQFLLQKEYKFLNSRKEKILNYANKLYSTHIEKQSVVPCGCNYSSLELGCKEYVISQRIKNEFEKNNFVYSSSLEENYLKLEDLLKKEITFDYIKEKISSQSFDSDKEKIFINNIKDELQTTRIIKNITEKNFIPKLEIISDYKELEKIVGQELSLEDIQEKYSNKKFTSEKDENFTNKLADHFLSQKKEREEKEQATFLQPDNNHSKEESELPKQTKPIIEEREL